MTKKTKKTKSSRRSKNNSMAMGLPTAALILGSVLPSALSPTPVPPNVSTAVAETAAKAKPHKAAAPKAFSISMKNLTDWAKTVVATMDAVSIE